ncbi:MAG: HNH endonuclease [Dehalococcoidia bacterium]|nr:HNH endonuclease [Dehalococcoidia bacterium]
MYVSSDEILTKFQNLRVWTRHGTRAPYKPMLAIWAVGRCLNGEARFVLFDTVHLELARLIRLFGPHRRRVPSAYPFWRMQHDGVWEIDRPHEVRLDASGNALVTSLRELGIKGGLTESIYRTLGEDRNLAFRVVLSLLDSHFPDSLHDDILRATVFDAAPAVDDNQIVESVVRYRKRDSAFRASVLDAYHGRCAVCELSLKLDEESIALEAAHIRWHAYSGPSEVRNGLALCVLHHKLFDLGAFTVGEDLNMLVSDYVTGHGKEASIGQYDGERIYLPAGLADSLRPDPEFVRWHRSEVFRSNV